MNFFGVCQQLCFGQVPRVNADVIEAPTKVDGALARKESKRIKETSAELEEKRKLKEDEKKEEKEEKRKPKRGSVNHGGGARVAEDVSDKPGAGIGRNSPEETPEAPTDVESKGLESVKVAGAKTANLPTFSEPVSATFPSPQELIELLAVTDPLWALLPHDFGLVGVTVVGSNRNASIAPDFTEKDLDVSGADDAKALRVKLAENGIGVACKKGRKPEQPNQDNCFFWQGGHVTVCCVADGHGRDGHWVSHWVGRCVLYLCLLEIASLGGEAPGQEAFIKIFDVAHQALLFVSKRDSFDVHLSGTTLSVCCIDRQVGAVVCAWCGDSRCTVGHASGKAETLSKDHKPQDAEEKRRIVSSGGEVVRLEGDIPHRVFKRGCETPGLAMSRALGDMAGHEVGVINKPDVKQVGLQPGGFVLCCSDGVWEFIKNNEACKLVHPLGREKADAAADKLTQEGRSRWLNEDDSMTDDITAIVVFV
eukprot:TRINITY_DN37883_c0_g1_i1.p1 TRINITY_DN37883_c0_g1~~TRINITY_DN37883_c0_g1_i1.p1  ORF type:complete len:479 (+),score=121.91 TRINITY_DN37883_c0_g1_i1:115-1551(+)